MKVKIESTPAKHQIDPLTSHKPEHMYLQSDEKTPVFPDDFVFGTAASAYQIEGAWNEDGKGESIWDRFTHTPGKTRNGETGDIACDFYHRYKEDIALMKAIGIQAFRFSINWTRILPSGRLPVNPKGLDFYQRVIDELLTAGIQPWVNLYHWDLPQALQDEGGWLNRECAAWFADYANVVVENLGDRITQWMTMNEPLMVAFLGYVSGYHAPGYKTPRSFCKVVHHLMLAHGMAARAIKAAASDSNVGIALDLRPIHPAANSKRDRRAVDDADGMMRRTFLDSILRAKYPLQFTNQFRPIRARIEEGDMALVAAPIDYIGINTYSRDIVRYDPLALGCRFSTVEKAVPDREFIENDVQYTSMGWEVYPPSLYEVLMFLKQEYGNPPVYITENGAAFTDAPVDGCIHDDKRTAYLQAHLAEVQRALADGANCKGYFVWTLLDNFEWAEGYGKRFGMVYVDHQTQERIIKDSGYWYQSMIFSQHKTPEIAL